MMTWYRNRIGTAFAAAVLVFTIMMAVAAGMLMSEHQVLASENAQEKEYVIDDAGILSDSEEQKLNALCQKASKNCKTDIVVLTITQGIDYSVFDQYIRDLLEANYGYSGTGAGGDAICFAVDMNSRAYRLVTSGIAKSDISQSQFDHIMEVSEDELRDADYYDAFRKYINNVERCLNQSILYKLTWNMPIKLLISLIVAIIAVLAMMYNAKAKITVGGTTYTKNHNFHVRAQRDDFINTTVVKRRIEKSTSSSGGGGGGNSGSGGGHF